MKIIIDLDSCEGNGVCERLAPDFFRLAGDQASIVNPTPPAEARVQIIAAVEGCPRAALRLEE